MSQPGAGGHIAGHVIGDDDVVVIQNNILPLLITAKHEERFDLQYLLSEVCIQPAVEYRVAHTGAHSHHVAEAEGEEVVGRV